MVAREYLRTTLRELTISQAAFARLVGRNPRTVKSWIGGRLAVPRWVLVLLVYMCRVKELDS